MARKSRPDTPATPVPPSMDLRTGIQNVTGVRSRQAPLLHRLGIHRAADLLFQFPRGFEQPAKLTTGPAFEDQSKVALIGRICEIDERLTSSGKHVLAVLLEVEDSLPVRLIWFNQPFRKQQLSVGTSLRTSGVLKSTGLGWEIVQPAVRVLEAGEDAAEDDRPLPLYPLTEGLKQAEMRALMREALPDLIPQVPEVLPATLRERLDIRDIQWALEHVHFPPDQQSAEQALRRFKIQELLVLQLAIALRRVHNESTATAPECAASGKVHSRILNRIGFELTGDQQRAISDIGRDMARSIPMRRLLQGDVGSGKTVVAQYAMLLCVAHGFQAALMAPTEVLAQQHAATLEKSLASSQVRVELLTGGHTKKQRSETLSRLAAGDIDLIVGTQALLSDDVTFAKLGLVIVDEQHKFGVLQRARLTADSVQPHYLVLSATPIPRTISMTEFGELDISTIREKPPGRAQVHSYTARTEDLAGWWKFVHQRLQEGRQAIVIAPRVSLTGEAAQSAGGQSPEPLDTPRPQVKNLSKATGSIANVEEVFDFLRQGPLQDWRIDLVHGQLPPAQKLEVMQRFAAGKSDVLVATTVVEVGIDIANATVMTILDADRLGLAQLHQLRGRVSRGSRTGYVCAVATQGAAPEDNQRLQAFADINDGFELAELDLQMRGPGNLLGTSQSGLPPLRVADLNRDVELLQLTRKVARELLAQDPQLSDPDFARLRRQTLNRYGTALQLSDVG